MKLLAETHTEVKTAAPQAAVKGLGLGFDKNMKQSDLLQVAGVAKLKKQFAPLPGKEKQSTAKTLESESMLPGNKKK